MFTGWCRMLPAIITLPALCCGHPDVGILAYGNNTLFGFTTQAVLQTPLP